MDPAELGAGAGRHYEYKNIVFQDFYFQEQSDFDPDPDHKSFRFVLPPDAGFTLPDVKVICLKTREGPDKEVEGSDKKKDRLLIQADRPSGGNRLRRLFHEFEVPAGYQGEKTVAVFQGGELTFTIPKTDDNSDGAETEPNTDPHAAPQPQAESHLAPTAARVPPPDSESEHRRVLEALFQIKTENQYLLDLYYYTSKKDKGVWR